MQVSRKVNKLIPKNLVATNDYFEGAIPSSNADGTTFTWITPSGESCPSGQSAYVYIAYASDNEGTDFTLTFNESLDYIAILSTDTEIISPVVSDFTGLWKNYKGAVGEAGSNGTNGINGVDGSDGREIELQVTETYIQWKYVGSDEEWVNLMPISSLIGEQGENGADGADGREIELQVANDYIQWRYNESNEEWVNLIATSTLKGDQGIQGVQGEKGDTGDVGNINDYPEVETVDDDDVILIENSESSFAKRKETHLQLKNYIKEDSEIDSAINNNHVHNLLLNGGFEYWLSGSCKFWRFSTGQSKTQESGEENKTEGSYSLKTVVATSANFFQTVLTLISDTVNASYKGKTITLSCQIKTSVPNAIRISIDTGVSETYSDYHTGSGEFETLSVTATIPNTANRLISWFIIKAPATVYFDDAKFYIIDNLPVSSNDHVQGTDTALGVMSANINMNSHKLTSLAVPSSNGDSIRATAKITEVNLEDAIDKKHSHSNITELDKVTIGDHDVSTGNPHETLASEINTTESNITVQDKLDSIPDELSDLSDDATHRLVTDTEKNTWNGKQDALGFTPENVSNKITIFESNVTDDEYPSAKLVYDNLELKVDKVLGKDLSTNDFTDEEQSKLASLENYTLLPATDLVLGGVIIGDRISIDSNGIISADVQSDENFTSTLLSKLSGIDENANNYELPTASESVLGGVKIGSGLEIDSNGVLSVEDLSGNSSISWQDAVNSQISSEPESPSTNDRHLVLEPTAENWLGTWKYRRKFTVDGSLIGSDLTHFPITLFLNSSSGKGDLDISDIFSELGENWNKIAITTDDGTTQIYVEVESWDSINGKAVIHCSKSDLVLSTSTDVNLYFYYDNNQDDNVSYVGNTQGTSPVTEVWDSNYKLVLHPTDITTATLKDSTSGDTENKDSANNPIISTNSNTIGAVSQLFTGDKITLADNYDSSTDFTVESLFLNNTDLYPVSSVVDPHLIAQGSTLSYTYGFVLVLLRVNDVQQLFFVLKRTGRSWGSDMKGTGVANIKDVWYYGAGVSSGNDIAVQQNTNEATLSGVSSAIDWGTDRHCYIGQQVWQNTSHPWNGNIGETRISDVARSKSWRDATYYSLFDNLVTWSIKEELCGGWVDYINYIVEFNGVSWDSRSPTEGMVVYVKDTDSFYIYNRTTWNNVGSISNFIGTGTGDFVKETSPTLVTPTLGVATATSINKVTITAPATSATLTIANGKTLTVNNTVTLAGTDATVITLPSATSTVATNTLNNLGSVAINTSLISDTNNTDDLGSDAKKWKDGYFAGIVTTSKLYQTNPVYVNARLNGTMTVNNTSWTKVTLSTEDADTNNNFDNVTNYRFTAPTSGYYDIDGMVGYGNPGGVHNCIEAALFINGAEYKRAIQDAPSVDVTPSVHGIVKLKANDYVELFAVSLLVNPTTIGHATAVSLQCRLTIMQIG